MKKNIRTDLAMESWDLARQEHGRGRGVPGVEYARKTIHNIAVHTMSIETQQAAEILCKPIGKYYTVSLKKMLRRYDDAFLDGAKCISTIVKSLLPEHEHCLIACLGNPKITPDAIGPLCADNLMVTRHLKAYMPETFDAFGEVSVICPGVLGTTGIESASIVKGAVEAVKPDVVIAIDALAARSMERLCTTIQICNTGIEPGSGVGNRRYALNEETLGVPVISAGIPTVVDTATLIADLTDEELQPKQGRGEDMMVTPREIDTFVADSAKLLAYGLNFALHEDLTLQDIDLFVS